MIISKTPYRISLFGGGTDYPEWYSKNGGAIISGTINKYIYISVRDLPNFFKHKFRISYSSIEEVQNIKEIKHTPIKKILKYLKLENNGLEIHYDGDLPAKSGMGSSSSFVVGLFNALHTKKNKYIMTKKKLSLKSIYLEQKVLNETVGIQDQIAVTYGGFSFISINTTGNYKIINFNRKISKKVEKDLFLVYTNVSRIANDIAKTYIHKLKKNNMLVDLQNITKEAYKDFSNNKTDKIDYFLNQSWKIKKKLSSYVTNPSIDSLYNFGLKIGATGGKLLGAGGGGFFLFYVPKENQKNFLIKMKKKKIVVPVCFEDSGSKIIFNSEVK